MRILNSCVVYQVSNCQPWVSDIPAAHLLCSIAMRRDISAALYFCSYELLCLKGPLIIYVHYSDTL